MSTGSASPQPRGLQAEQDPRRCRSPAPPLCWPAAAGSVDLLRRRPTGGVCPSDSGGGDTSAAACFDRRTLFCRDSTDTARSRRSWGSRGSPRRTLGSWSPSRPCWSSAARAPGSSWWYPRGRTCSASPGDCSRTQVRPSDLQISATEWICLGARSLLRMVVQPWADRRCWPAQACKSQATKLWRWPWGWRWCILPAGPSCLRTQQHRHCPASWCSPGSRSPGAGWRWRIVEPQPGQEYK